MNILWITVATGEKVAMIQLVLHLAQVKIKAVFNVLHSHTLLCLKFPDVKSFPRPQQERIARTNNLNWQHH